MNDLISIFKKDINRLIDDLENQKIIINLNKDFINIDYSSKSKQGDLSSNIFLILMKKNLNKKFDLKTYIYNYFKNLKYVDKVVIASAGFINIFLKKSFIVSQLENIFCKKSLDIKPSINKQKINIEFVSANPTGPIHIAHIRGAVLGDVLASILEFFGHQVTREYYVNDSGSQITSLGRSLFKRYQELCGLKISFVDGEYPGQYLKEIAKEILSNDGKKWLKVDHNHKRSSYFEKYAIKFLIAKIQKDLSLIDINFDKFTFESNIVKNKFIDKVFDILKERNLLFEGILEKPLGENNEDWVPRKQLLFRSTNFSDDADRPFKKVNGEWTYFANDAAYHYEKYLREFDQLINIWGADHIGYISRMKSIVEVISDKKNYLEVFICQIVRLIKDDELLKMSKRKGNFITLENIYKEVGKDALRYFMVSSKSETPMDFNLNKVIEKNKDNPVFYCQYAYARASSVIRKANEFNNLPNIYNSFDLFDSKIISDYEWEIIFKILSWPHILFLSAKYRQPHRITNFLEDLCKHFHSFWNKGKDNISLRLIDENNINKTITKLIWIETLRMTLSQAFKIIGIRAPESM